jgi:hypothetical protein
MTVVGIFVVGFMLLFVGGLACCLLYAISTTTTQSRRIGPI